MVWLVLPCAISLETTNTMKKLIALSLLAAIITLTGCKTNDNANVGPALLRLGVSTAAGYSLLKHPEAVAGVSVGASIICAAANGTNISPAQVVAALNAYGELTPEAVFVLNAAIGAYTLAFNGLSDTNNATANPYLVATCGGLQDALLIPVSSLTGVSGAGGAASFSRTSVVAADKPVVGWPQVKFK